MAKSIIVIAIIDLIFDCQQLWRNYLVIISCGLFRANIISFFIVFMQSVSFFVLIRFVDMWIRGEGYCGHLLLRSHRFGARGRYVQTFITYGSSYLNNGHYI